MLTMRKACAIFGTAASATYVVVARQRSCGAFCESKPVRQWNSNWDYRQPPPLDSESKPSSSETSALPSSKCRHIYLVRHGQYKVASAKCDEQAILTKLGRQQAELTGIRLHELGVKFDSVVNSTMTRARETADIICQHVSAPREECAMISEGAPCPPDPPHPSWAPTPREFFEESARIEAGFRKFFHRAPPEQTQDTNLLLVCHGNVIRYMICRALQLPPEAWLRFGLRHGSITKITIFPDGDVELTFCGDTGYMPGNVLSQ